MTIPGISFYSGKTIAMDSPYTTSVTKGTGVGTRNIYLPKGDYFIEVTTDDYNTAKNPFTFYMC